MTDGVEAFGQVEAAHGILARVAVQLFLIADNDRTDAAMQARFRTMFDADHWRHDTDGWTIIGLNAGLFGTGEKAEAAQSAWLRKTLGDIAGPIGVFLHQPWFRDASDRTDRQEAALAFAGHDLRFIASGHSHQLRALAGRGADRYWTPSAIAAGDRMWQRDATKSVGFDMLTLTIDGRSFHHVGAPGTRRNDPADARERSPDKPRALAEAL